MRRVFVGILAAAIVVAVASAAGVVWRVWVAPAAGGRHRAPARPDARPCEVLRDAHGIPHIRAASEADAFAALGWVHAQDRLWQMEFQRRLAAGRLAELLGEAGARHRPALPHAWASRVRVGDLGALRPW
jgi:penicillin G amidase